MKLKTIEVGCAVIVKKGKILISQRKPGDSLGGYWEFPGGKLEKGESLEACLKREAKEELGVEIRVRRFFCTVEHRYPERKILLHFYFCDWITGQPVCHDCLDFAWVAPGELFSYRLPPADTDVIHELVRKKHIDI